MIYLLLSILCSTSIVLILKFSDTRKGHPLILLAGNYTVASLISLVFFLFRPAAEYSAESLGFGAVVGLFFMLSFFSYAKAISAAGAALASISARISVGIPVVLAMLLYGEVPGTFQIAGFILSALTLLFFYYSLKSANTGHIKGREYFYLFSVFLIIGLNEFAMKIFQQWRPMTEKPFFLLIIFSAALLFTLAAVKVKKVPFDKKAVSLGLILGIPNIFSSFFLLNALEEIEAIIVYPVLNTGIILLTAFGASLIWGERLNLHGKLALLIGIAAIIFLSLG